MTKRFNKILLLLVVILFTLTLTGCGFASKAEKLEAQFADGKSFTLEDIEDKMGDPTTEIKVPVIGGTATWYEGCEDMEDVYAKWEANESVAALVVTFDGNEKVTSITFVAEAKEEK